MGPPQPGSERGPLVGLLPSIYQEQPQVRQLLGAFETVLFGGTDSAVGLAGIIAALPELLDPQRARPEFLPWLARWVGLRIPPGLPLDAQRELIAHAVPLYQRRGTKAGLQQLLDIVSGSRASVVEPAALGFRLGDAIIGRTTYVGRDRPHYFEIVLRVTVRTFVDLAKPAHTHYSLRIADAEAGGGGTDQ
jgi:phage tail-like protein